MSNKRFSVEAVFKAIDKVTAPVSRMQNRIGKMTRKAGRDIDRLNRKMDKFSSGAKKAATAVGVAAAIAIGGYVNIVNTGAEFQQSLISAAAKFPGIIRRGTEAYEELNAAARKAGATTEFTATESAAAFNFLAMAGLNAKSSIAALPTVIDLATVAEMDLATATDVATDSLGAFNLLTNDSVQLAKNLTRVTDVLSTTANRTNTTVSAFFEAISEGGPVVTTTSGSIETFAALAGKLASAGIKGGRAGTVLKNTFLSLAATTPAADKALQAMGVSVKDSSGDLRDIIEIVRDLNVGLGDLGTADRARVLKEIFGKRNLAGVNILLGTGADELVRFRTELEGSAGSTKTLADVIRDSLRGRLNSLNSAVESVKIAIFEMNEGPLEDTIDLMTKWVRANEGLIATKVGDFVAKVFDNLEQIIRVGKRLAIVTGVVTGLVFILKGLALILTVVNLVMAANPIVLAVIAIVGLIAAIGALIVKLGGFKKVWTDVSDFLLENPFAILALGLLGPYGIVAGIALLIKKFGGLQKVWTFITENPFAIMAISLFGPAGVIAGITLLINKLGGLKEILTSLISKKAASLGSFLSGGPMGIASGIGGLIGFGGGGDDEDSQKQAAAPQIVTPSERTARSIEENRTVNSSEVTIRDETGRAEVTRGTFGAGLILQPSGAF